MASGKIPKLIPNRIQNGSRTDSNSAPYPEWDAEMESGLDQHWSRNWNWIGIGTVCPNWIRIWIRIDSEMDQDMDLELNQLCNQEWVETISELAEKWCRGLSASVTWIWVDPESESNQNRNNTGSGNDYEMNHEKESELVRTPGQKWIRDRFPFCPDSEWDSELNSELNRKWYRDCTSFCLEIGNELNSESYQGWIQFRIRIECISGHEGLRSRTNH